MSEHPARPQQHDDGFAEGQAREADPPEDRADADFARGQDAGRAESDDDFAEGQRDRGEPGAEGDFASGMRGDDEA